MRLSVQCWTNQWFFSGKGRENCFLFGRRRKNYFVGRGRENCFFADGGRVVSSAEGGRIGFGKGRENGLFTAGDYVVPSSVVVENFPLVINEMEEELDFVIVLIPVQFDLEFVFWVALVRVPCAFHIQTVLVPPLVERVT